MRGRGVINEGSHTLTGDNACRMGIWHIICEIETPFWGLYEKNEFFFYRTVYIRSAERGPENAGCEVNSVGIPKITALKDEIRVISESDHINTTRVYYFCIKNLHY